MTVNDIIAKLSPSWALARDTAQLKRRMISDHLGPGASQSYDAASRSSRASDFRYNRRDAVEAGRFERERISWMGRDMLRNNPRVKKARKHLVGSIVGAGIVPNVRMADPADTESKAQIEKLIRRHCLTQEIDAGGKLNLFGLQALICGSIILDGEVIIRRRQRFSEDGLAMPWQLQVLESDYLNSYVDGPLPGGNKAVQGVEFDLLGRRAAYHLFERHPGSRYGGYPATKRIPAQSILHPFEMERPGQVRGVSWIASVVTLLHELQKYQDGQVRRQEIAALFAAILTSEKESDELEESLGQLESGTVLRIGSDEKMDFTDPPAVDGYEPFMRGTDRTIAGALDMTYESFSGDYSNVNYSSARVGRNDIDPIITQHQNHLMIAQVCNPIGEWIKESVSILTDIDPESWELDWTPPRKPMVDPTKEIPAFEKGRKAGLYSRREVIRERGRDPQKVEQEILEEQAWADDHNLTFSSDAGSTIKAAQARSDQTKTKG